MSFTIKPLPTVPAHAGGNFIQRAQGAVLGSIFFLFYFGLSTWLPFFNIYLKNQGYSGSQVGVIAGMYQAVLFFVVPVWGVIADRFGNRRVLHLVLFCAGALIWGLRLISGYRLLILYVMTLAFMHHPLGMLTDSLAIGYVKHHPRAAFGEFRVWGSVGWALGNIVMGRFLLTQPLSLTFTVAALYYGVTWLAVWLFQDKRYSAAPRRFVAAELKTLFINSRMLFFLLLLMLYGIGISPLYIFLNLYFRDIGANAQTIGLAFAIAAFSEVPFFFLANRMVKRFSARKVLPVSMAVAVLRLVLYGLIGSPLPALIVGVGSGFTYSLFWVAIVEIMHEWIPGKWRSTAQSLLWAVHVGLGVTIGNMSIGALSDHFHMQSVMLMAGAISALVAVGMTAYFHKFRESRRAAEEGEIIELPHVVAEE